MNVLISIIIPAYNVEDYIDECILSVLSQSYTNIEIIIINDGSSDRTADIIQKYTSSDSRIIFINNKNVGLGTTRNEGIEKSKGNYILFIDSDDYIHPDLVQHLLDKIEDKDICMYDAVAFEDESRVFSKQKYFKGLDNKVLQQKIETNTYRGYLFFYISSCLKLYNSDFLKNNRILFPEGVYGEDDMFWLYCILKTKRIVYTDFIGYYRRFRAGSIMTAGSIKNLQDRVGSMPKLFSLSENDNGLINKILIYALECWFKVYEQDDKELKEYTKKIYNSVRLKNIIGEIKAPLDIRLRYFLCEHTNRTCVLVYKFWFENFYLKLKRLIKSRKNG